MALTYGAENARIELILAGRLPESGPALDAQLAQVRLGVIKVLKAWDGDEQADLAQMMTAGSLPEPICRDLACVPLDMPGGHRLPFVFAVLRDANAGNAESVEAFIVRSIGLGLAVDEKASLIRGQVRDHHDCNMLHAAILAPGVAPRTLELLLGLGIDPMEMTREGETALALAAESRWPAFAQVLQDFRPNKATEAIEASRG